MEILVACLLCPKHEQSPAMDVGQLDVLWSPAISRGFVNFLCISTAKRDGCLVPDDGGLMVFNYILCPRSPCEMSTPLEPATLPRESSLHDAAARQRRNPSARLGSSGRHTTGGDMALRVKDAHRTRGAECATAACKPRVSTLQALQGKYCKSHFCTCNKCSRPGSPSPILQSIQQV